MLKIFDKNHKLKYILDDDGKIRIGELSFEPEVFDEEDEEDEEEDLDGRPS